MGQPAALKRGLNRLLGPLRHRVVGRGVDIAEGKGGHELTIRAATAPRTSRDRAPIAPAPAQAPVGRKLIDDLSVGGLRVGELPHQLGRDPIAFLVLIGVIGVDSRQDFGCSVFPEVLGERGEVQVVAGLIAPHDQERLDPQRLLDGRHREFGSRGEADRGDLQRSLADHLADPCLDPIEAPQDHFSWGDPVRRPALVFLDRFEHYLEAVGEVGEDVIVIARFAVVRVEDRRGAAHSEPRLAPAAAGARPIPAGRRTVDPGR